MNALTTILQCRLNAYKRMLDSHIHFEERAAAAEMLLRIAELERVLDDIIVIEKA